MVDNNDVERVRGRADLHERHPALQALVIFAPGPPKRRASICVKAGSSSTVKMRKRRVFQKLWALREQNADRRTAKASVMHSAAKIKRLPLFLRLIAMISPARFRPNGP
jgi:hypothetical protein